MSIIYKGKVYRNIQEQVKKNMEDIALLQENTAETPKHLYEHKIRLIFNNVGSILFTYISRDNTVLNTKEKLMNIFSYNIFHSATGYLEIQGTIKPVAGICKSILNDMFMILVEGQNHYYSNADYIYDNIRSIY